MLQKTTNFSTPTLQFKEKNQKNNFILILLIRKKNRTTHFINNIIETLLYERIEL